MTRRSSHLGAGGSTSDSLQHPFDPRHHPAVVAKSSSAPVFIDGVQNTVSEVPRSSLRSTAEDDDEPFAEGIDRRAVGLRMDPRARGRRDGDASDGAVERGGEGRAGGDSSRRKQVRMREGRRRYLSLDDEVLEGAQGEGMDSRGEGKLSRSRSKSGSRKLEGSSPEYLVQEIKCDCGCMDDAGTAGGGGGGGGPGQQPEEFLPDDLVRQRRWSADDILTPCSPSLTENDLLPGTFRAGESSLKLSHHVRRQGIFTECIRPFLLSTDDSRFPLLPAVVTGELRFPDPATTPFVTMNPPYRSPGNVSDRPEPRPIFRDPFSGITVMNTFADTHTMDTATAPTSSQKSKRPAEASPHLTSWTKQRKVTHGWLRSCDWLFKPPPPSPSKSAREAVSGLTAAAGALPLCPLSASVGSLSTLSSLSSAEDGCKPGSAAEGASYTPRNPPAFALSQPLRPTKMAPDEGVWVGDGKGWTDVDSRLSKRLRRLQLQLHPSLINGMGRRSGQEDGGRGRGKGKAKSDDGLEDEDDVDDLEEYLSEDEDDSTETDDLPRTHIIRRQFSAPAAMESLTAAEVEYLRDSGSDPTVSSTPELNLASRPSLLPRFPVQLPSHAPLKDQLLAVLRSRQTQAGGSSRVGEAGVRFRKWVCWNAWMKRTLSIRSLRPPAASTLLSSRSHSAGASPSTTGAPALSLPMPTVIHSIASSRHARDASEEEDDDENFDVFEDDMDDVLDEIISDEEAMRGIDSMADSGDSAKEGKDMWSSQRTIRVGQSGQITDDTVEGEVLTTGAMEPLSLLSNTALAVQRSENRNQDQDQSVHERAASVPLSLYASTVTVLSSAPSPLREEVLPTSPLPPSDELISAVDSRSSSESEGSPADTSCTPHGNIPTATLLALSTTTNGTTTMISRSPHPSGSGSNTPRQASPSSPSASSSTSTSSSHREDHRDRERDRGASQSPGPSPSSSQSPIGYSSAEVTCQG